ncbi:hypothetical protein B566_EDAN016792 [Ephemera danica]|nr:hypothetical protein B566_EDAN016792 [Ephemera danica]
MKATPNELQLRWKRLRVFPAHSWHQPKEPPGEQWTRDESEVEGECFIHKLNDDCLLYIFKFLEIKEQMKMERVCKRWQDLSQSMWLRRSDFDLSCLSDKSSHFSVPAFRKVLRFCGEHLTKLDFCTVKSDSLSAVLPLVTHNCPNLEVLKLSEVSVNRCALHSLSSKCRNLRCLTLRGCQGIKDYELGRLVSRLDKLEHLDVSKNTVIQGYFLRSIKPNLVSLVLDECNNLGLKHLLSELSKPHWNVRMLSLNSCQTLTSLDVQTLCTSAAPKLKQLRLNEYFPRLNTGSLRALGSLSELTHLSVKFNSCVKKDVILKICDGCLKLEELDISAVARLKHLERLKLNYVMIYDVALENLAKHCKGLRLLECKGCPNITHIGVASVLARCTRLETLDLSGCYITNEVVTDATLAVGARKEKIKLTLYLGGTQVVKTDVDDLNQPLLKIILEDRSIRHLRPDYSDDVYFEHYYEGDSDYDVYDSDESVNEEELQVLLNILAG